MWKCNQKEIMETELSLGVMINGDKAQGKRFVILEVKTMVKEIT